jgi:Ca-activated chloride channel homolog
MPLMVLLLPVTLMLSALAINIAYIELSRTEMFICADFVTRAAGRDFAISGDKANAMKVGRQVATLNTVNNQPMQLADSDFVFGEASRPDLSKRYVFDPSGTFPNAVEVTLRKTSSTSNGSLTIPFPMIFGGGASIDSTKTSRSNPLEADIAIVLDRSGSMAYAANEIADGTKPKSAPTAWTFGQAVPPNSRWLDAVASVKVFMAEIAKTPMKEQVSLSTYNTDAGTDIFLTTDQTPIVEAMDKYSLNFYSGGTNITSGLDCGRLTLLSSLSRPYAAKVMIILTDGINNVGTQAQLFAAAQAAADKKIIVYTVTFSNEADKTTMAKIAAIGLGKYAHATSSADLQNVFKDIAKGLPLLLTQ